MDKIMQSLLLILFLTFVLNISQSYAVNAFNENNVLDNFRQTEFDTHALYLENGFVFSNSNDKNSTMSFRNTDFYIAQPTNYNLGLGINWITSEQKEKSESSMSTLLSTNYYQNQLIQDQDYYETGIPEGLEVDEKLLSLQGGFDGEFKYYYNQFFWGGEYDAYVEYRRILSDYQSYNGLLQMNENLLERVIYDALVTWKIGYGRVTRKKNLFEAIQIIKALEEENLLKREIDGPVLYRLADIISKLKNCYSFDQRKLKNMYILGISKFLIEEQLVDLAEIKTAMILHNTFESYPDAKRNAGAQMAFRFNLDAYTDTEKYKRETITNNDVDNFSYDWWTTIFERYLGLGIEWDSYNPFALNWQLNTKINLDYYNKFTTSWYGQQGLNKNHFLRSELLLELNYIHNMNWNISLGDQIALEYINFDRDELDGNKINSINYTNLTLVNKLVLTFNYKINQSMNICLSGLAYYLSNNAYDLNTSLWKDEIKKTDYFDEMEYQLDVKWKYRFF